MLTRRASLKLIAASPVVLGGATAHAAAPASALSREIPGLVMADPYSPGYLHELVHEAASRLGRTVQVSIVPWARAMKLAALRQADLIFPVPLELARREGLTPLVRLLDLDHVFVTAGRSVNGIEEARGLDLVAVSAGSDGEAELRAAGLGNLEPSDGRTAALKLAGGRVRAWYTSLPEALWTWRAERLHGLAALVPGRTVRTEPLYLAGCRPDAGEPDGWSRALEALAADGTVAALKDRYNLV
ncbi:MAG TPA: transporter substrate-binding domain-containing protein [Azospirillaceae bacterium]|nr:transporter substrate-binding domain-containing protein [Azospirillaceae bacterium]